MELPCIEIPVDYTVAPCARAHPFHWALLRTLTAFAPGARPDFATLASRLRFFEAAFLEAAWSELCNQGAVSATDYMRAEISPVGTEALRTGYFVSGRTTTRQATLYISARGDRCVERQDFEVVTGAPLRAPPPWAKTLTVDRILDALRHQTPDRMPKPDERILEFSARWGEAVEAVARW